jgi:hypothetical protein
MEGECETNFFIRVITFGTEERLHCPTSLQLHRLAPYKVFVIAQPPSENRLTSAL